MVKIDLTIICNLPSEQKHRLISGYMIGYSKYSVANLELSLDEFSSISYIHMIV